MDKFDKYYKHKNLKINDKLVNGYAKYDDETLLISNGYSVVYTKTIRSDFKELTDNYGIGLKRHYNNFNNFEAVDTILLDTIKNGLDEDKYYIFTDDKSGKYAIDYMLVKKIIDIIGYSCIEIISDGYTKIFKIKGVNQQIGYLLPCRVY